VLVELTKKGHAETWTVLQHFIGDVVQIAAARSASESRVVGRFLDDLIDAVDTDTRRLQAR